MAAELNHIYDKGLMKSLQTMLQETIQRTYQVIKQFPLLIVISITEETHCEHRCRQESCHRTIVLFLWILSNGNCPHSQQSLLDRQSTLIMSVNGVTNEHFSFETTCTDII